MGLKLSAGFVILLIALALQFSLAANGLYFNLSFAVLISFAFVFGFWELLCLVLVAVFIVNWQPAGSVEMLIFAFYPVAVYFSRNLLHWQVWLQSSFAILVGFLVLYLAVAPGRFLSHWGSFAADAFVGMLFAALPLLPLYRWGKE